MVKRYFALFFLMLFLLVIVWLFIEGLKPEVLPIGSKLPNISYTDIDGSKLLKLKNETQILIIFFSEKCPYCKFILNDLNNNINELKNVSVYLFTTDKEYLESKNIKKYTELLNSVSATFGMINLEMCKSKFGGSATPALYFFNKKGVLYAKKTGAIKYDHISSEIKTNNILSEL